MLILRVIMYWFASDCCKVVFHITRACRLHVPLFVCFGVFVCACMFVLRVIAYAFAFVFCKVALHIRRVCILHVWFVFVIMFVCLCLLA